MIAVSVSGGAQASESWNQALQPISNFDLSALCVVDGSVASLDIRPNMTKMSRA